MVSRLRLILIHLLKCVSQPESDSFGHWRAEMVGGHTDLLEDLTRAMQARIDMDLIWRRAIRQAEAALSANRVALAPGLPVTCPIGLAELLGDELDVPALVTRIEAARASP